MIVWTAQVLWAQTGGFGDFGDDIVRLGGYGLLIVLLLTRQLKPSGDYNEMKEEKDARFDEMRKELLDRSMRWEQAAENWRAVAAVANKDREAAVEAARSVESAFNALREVVRSREP